MAYVRACCDRRAATKKMCITTRALTVEQLDGKQPDLYVNDLVRGEQVYTGREAVVLELVSRYHNPDFIRAMQTEGYDGARYLSRIADNQFGWNVVSDVVTAEDWKQFAEVYLDDKHQLGLRQFFDQHNPYALQNIASRVLETHRKGLHELDAKTLNSAARVYVETVAQHGAACASHICGNPGLATMAEKLVGASQEVDEATLARFRRRMQRTGNAELSTAVAAGGAANEPATAPQPVEGRLLTPPPTDPAGQEAQDRAPSPPPPTAVPAPLNAAQRSPSGTPATGPNSAWLVTLLAALLSGAAFALGMLWRAAHNRRTKS